MDKLIIEKNIPIPNFYKESSHAIIREKAFKMKIGDSMLLPCSKDKVLRMRGRFTQLVNRAGSTRKFVSRTVEGGLRVWRIK